MTNPTADLFTRISNAKLAKNERVSIPYSRYKMMILEVLNREGYIGNINEDKKNGMIRVEFSDTGRHFEKIEVISKPSSKIYVKKNKIPRSKGGYGTVILSTPKGVMSDNEARKNGVGGELVCEIY